MVGVYIYCVRERREGVRRLAVAGIDDTETVFCFPYEDLEAVVSEVALDVYASEKIRERAKHDLGWIKTKAVSHQTVIAEAMKGNGEPLAVIPMKFGIIFKDKARLRDFLNKDYSKIKEKLIGLRGKQEWGLKVFLKDKKRLEKHTKAKSAVIQEKEKEIAGLDEGTAFFMEENLKETISREVDRELGVIVAEVSRRVEKTACSVSEGKILEKELVGRREPMVSNASYLVAGEAVEQFKMETAKVNQQLQDKGLSLECSGPWPPYNFASY